MKLETVRVLDAWKALDYQRSGICSDCGESRHVGRKHGSPRWLCSECWARRAEKKGRR